MSESPQQERANWNPIWEDIYGNNREMNRYPHHTLVGFVFRHYGKVQNRGAVAVLELGFGAGNNLWFLAREGFGVAGVEGAPSAVAFARQRFAADGLAGDLRVGDFTRLPWDDGSFDLVVDRGSLTSSARSAVAAALEESRRVLKPGGRLFSMIYSDAHPGRAFGTQTEPQTYDHFTGGYFQGHGTVSFCSRADIDTLYGRQFEIESLKLTLEEEHLQGVELTNALWTVVGQKTS